MITNVASDPQHTFQLEPTTLLHEIMRAESSGLEWLGVWHSHPTTDPIPSSIDIGAARLLPERFAHLILGLHQTVPQVQIWHIAGDITPFSVLLEDEPTDSVKDEHLSKAQWISILTAVIVSIILFLVIAVTLLPPAPIIPLVR